MSFLLAAHARANAMALQGATTIELRRKVELSHRHITHTLFRLPSSVNPDTALLSLDYASAQLRRPGAVHRPLACRKTTMGHRRVSQHHNRPKAVVLRLFRLLCYSCHLNRFLCQPQRPSYRSPSQALQQVGLT